MITVNCDGGARGNPGKAAIGIILREGEEIIEKHRERIGKATNNIAEYRGLIKALEICFKREEKEIEVNMDSELVVKQMKGEYKVKSDDLKKLFEKAKEIESKFVKVKYYHVRREDKFQSEADRLVNEALDE